jgi:hypothetical protein
LKDKHLIIDLKQTSNNVPINMHNIYVTLSQFHSLDGFVILRDISIKDICKAKLKKKKSSNITKPLSNQKNTNTNGIKTNKDIEIPMDSNIDLKKCDVNLLHNKEFSFFTISNESKNDSGECANINYWIDYWIESLQ